MGTAGVLALAVVGEGGQGDDDLVEVGDDAVVPFGHEGGRVVGELLGSPQAVLVAQVLGQHADGVVEQQRLFGAPGDVDAAADGHLDRALHTGGRRWDGGPEGAEHVAPV